MAFLLKSNYRPNFLQTIFQIIRLTDKRHDFEMLHMIKILKKTRESVPC